MCRKGNCWDNAVVESFFSSLKMELVHEADFATREQATAALFEYLEVFYNRKRRHSSLGYMSPVEYERSVLPCELAAESHCPLNRGNLTRRRGIFPIGVGHGKTLIDLLLPLVMPACKVAVLLLLPANLRAQLADVDWHFYGGHWRLPNLAGGRWFRPGLPVLHVISYEKFSTQEGTDLLTRIRPDLIICDEAHKLKDRKSARTGRFLRYLDAHPETRLVAQSGTLATRTIKVDERQAGTHLLIRCEIYPKQLPPKDWQPGKVISSYRWTHVELNDEQLAEVEQARKASKLPSLADALSLARGGCDDVGPLVSAGAAWRARPGRPWSRDDVGAWRAT